MDTGIATVISSFLALFGVVYVARQNNVQSRKLNDVHRQTNQNSHKNETPTLLDLMDDLRGDVNHLKCAHESHLEWHLNKEAE